MSKKSFLFSGQGSQYVGMSKELYEAFPECKKIFDTAKKILGFDLYDICVNADDATLAKTIYSQPAIFATSLCALAAAEEKGISADCVAGHSLGEYAAMVACKMISAEDGFRLIKARSEAMQRCCENSKGSMCAVIGTDSETVERICSETEGYVVPVNYNSAVQTVIAGEADAVEKAAVKFSEIKAKAIKLNVASAFHSKIMAPASEEFFEAVKSMDINFCEPQIPFYSNITGDILTDFSDMPSLLSKHIVSPVRFTTELLNMSKNGIDCFIELGPNKVLTGLVKKTLKGVTAVNIENTASLEKALSSLYSE